LYLAQQLRDNHNITTISVKWVGVLYRPASSSSLDFQRSARKLPTATTSHASIATQHPSRQDLHAKRTWQNIQHNKTHFRTVCFNLTVWGSSPKRHSCSTGRNRFYPISTQDTYSGRAMRSGDKEGSYVKKKWEQISIHMMTAPC
jgi:hypothetical protein